MKYLGWSLVIIWLVALTYYTLFFETDKQGYVDLNVVYKEFNLTKELTNQFDQIETSRQANLDSLKVQVLKHEQESAEFQNFYQQFLAKQNEYNVLNEKMGVKFDNQIWKQINASIKRFGEESNYEIIYGTKGDGVIMYAQKHQDLTTLFLTFLNEDYEGS